MPVIIISTRRLHLRPFRTGDTEAVLAYANDPEWVRYLVNIPCPFTLEDAESFIYRFSDLSRWDELPMFAVTIEDTAIGSVYLNLDFQNDRAELGYDLARIHWGKGLATEAVASVLDWAFGNLPLHRIFATVDRRNTQSVRVLEKLGMIKEGLLRQHVKWNGEYRDNYYYGLLKKDWQKGETNGKTF